MMTTSRACESTTMSARQVAGMPAGAGRVVHAALRNEIAHASGKAAQRDLGAPEGSGRVASRSHAGLHPLDERLVLDAHPAVDAPIEIARGAHFPPRIRM